MGPWSGHEMARRRGVHQSFANDIKNEVSSLSVNDCEQPRTRQYTTKHGTEATMHVEKTSAPYLTGSSAETAASFGGMMARIHDRHSPSH